jgi:hypothetical protein
VVAVNDEPEDAAVKLAAVAVDGPCRAFGGEVVNGEGEALALALAEREAEEFGVEGRFGAEGRN